MSCWKTKLYACVELISVFAGGGLAEKICSRGENFRAKLGRLLGGIGIYANSIVFSAF
jgi:hypothetical protein